MNDTGVKGVTNLEEGVEWGGKEGGRIVMVDAGAEGAVGRRVSRNGVSGRTVADLLLPGQGRPLDYRHRTLGDRAHSGPARRLQGVPLHHVTTQSHCRCCRSTHQGGLRGCRLYPVSHFLLPD